MSKSKLFYGWYILAATWLMSFLVGAVSIAVFFKPILEDFGLDRATLSSVESVALVAFTLFSPFLGRMIDRFGPKAVIFVAVGTQTLSRLLNGLAMNVWFLYLARFLYGVNATPSTQILVNRWFVRWRGTAQGLAATSMPLGTMLLAPVSQILILRWGWRPTMFFWAAITFAVMLPAAFILSNSPEEKGTGPDGDPIRGPVSPGDPSNQRTIFGSEIKKSLWLILKTRPFAFLALSHLICGLGCGLIMTHIVVFATDLGYSDLVGASLLSVMAASCLVGVLVTGWLSDRISRKNALALTFLIRSLSFIILLNVENSPLWVLYVAMIFFGFGWFTTAPLTAGMAGDLFGDLRIGTVLGVITSFHMLGMAVGAAAGGMSFDLTGGYHLIFLVQAPLEAAACLLVYFAGTRAVAAASALPH